VPVGAQVPEWDGKVKSNLAIPNPGHQPGFLPVYLGDMGVTCIIAGGMGPRAQTLFEERGIRAVVGVWERWTGGQHLPSGGASAGGKLLRSPPGRGRMPSWVGKAIGEVRR